MNALTRFWRAPVLLGAGICLGLVAPYAADAETTVFHWTGGGNSNEWNVAANWQEGYVPSNCTSKCVFDLGSGVSLSIARTMPNGTMPNLELKSGNLTMSGNLTLPYYDHASGMTNIFDIASGSTFTTTSMIGPPSVDVFKWSNGVVKRGGGKWTHTSTYGPGSGNRTMSVLVVEGGTAEFTAGSAVLFANIYTRAGANYICSGWRAVWSSTAFHTEAGSTVGLNSEHLTYSFRGIDGNGTLYQNWAANGSFNWSMRLSLSGGPYRFGGLVEFRKCSTKQPALMIGFNDVTVPAAQRHFVVCNTNTLAGTGDWYVQPYVPLEWGRGIGCFHARPLVYVSGVDLSTEDEDGEPIELHMGIKTTPSPVRITGSGSWYARDNVTTVTGAQVSVTGKIGSDAGATLVLGDGTAAGDVDLSQYAGVDAQGNLTFNNVALRAFASAFTVGGTLAASGPMSFASDLTAGGAVTFGGATTVGGDLTAGGVVTFNGATTVTGEVKAASLAVNAPSTVGRYEGAGISGVNADFTLASGDIRGTVSVGTGTLTLENTTVLGGYGRTSTQDAIYSAALPQGVLINGTAANSAIVFGKGVDAWCNASGSTYPKMPSFTVRDGGCLTFLAGGAWGASDAADALTATLDGGTIQLSSWDQPTGFSFPSSSSKWTLRIGAKGGVFENRAAHGNGLKNHLRYTDSLASVSGVSSGKDGGLVFAVNGVFNVNKTQRFTGPLTARDGLVRMNALLEDNAVASGDIVLDGGVLVLGADLTADLNPLLAPADDATFTYRGSSHLELGQDNGNGTFSVRSVPQTYHIGPTNDAAEFAALVRGGKGSVLLLAGKAESTPALGSASGNKVLVNGGVETNAAGVVRAPIFSARYFTDNFLKYDPTDGFVEFADGDYATSLDAGADKYVKISTAGGVAGQTLSGEAQVAGLRLDYYLNKVPLTLNAGSVLKMGDGVHPAAILFNTVYYNYEYPRTVIDGSGAIDFGSSEGVFVTPMRYHSAYDPPPRITAAIRGQSGLTVVGDPLGVNPRFFLAGANDFAGGLFVDMIDVRGEGASPFGVGTITVRGRRLNGGTVSFLTANLTHTNDFVLTGYGTNPDCEGRCYGVGAICFRAKNVRLTGDIRVDGYSRITQACAPQGAVSTIAGVISGGELQFFGGISENAKWSQILVDGLAEEKKIVLEGHNTLTGNVEIVRTEVVLKGADPALGTGEVLVDAGILTFENTADVTFPNDMRGNGTVKLNGQNVSFTGDLNVDGQNALKVDLAGTSPTLKEMPPFATITNSATQVAKVTLKGALTIDPTAYAYLTPNVRLVLDGATVDLAGQTLTVERAYLRSGGRFVNGTLVETNPRKGMAVFLK